MMQQRVAFVLYDSIKNSVFDGQVLKPLIAFLEKNPTQHGYIISFEKNDIPRAALEAITTQHARLHIIILKKIPYLGRITLWYAIWQLKKVAHTFTHYSIQARGPLAGYICLHAFKNYTTFLVQARGLLAAEYQYAHRHDKNFIKQCLHHFRYRQFLNLEQWVYSSKHAARITFEAVSDALKEYLITSFGTHRNQITVAQNDIPALLTKKQRDIWRTTIRQKLGIHPHAIVYCYNGSIKPWQCPQETIEFFVHKQKSEPHAFLLILTPDVEAFEALIQRHTIATTSYAALRVSHTAIYEYLSAGDIGLLFREKHIINWTSRPTKILEYQAVGLTIVHNNTVALLIPTHANMPVQNPQTMDLNNQSGY